MKLVIVPLAQAEAHNAASFYTAKANRELGLAFLAEFEKTTNLLFVNPFIGAIFLGAVRRFSLRRFPYSVIYQVTQEELRIIAVAHHRRRPDYWVNRK